MTSGETTTVTKDDQMRIHLGANTRPISFEYYVKDLGNEQVTSATYYYHYDLHGNVIRVTDSSGTTQITYTYDQLGTITSTTNANSIYNPFTYMGEAQIIQDSEFDTSGATPKTGLYASGSSYYNPETGTFLQGAGIPATTNPTSNFAEMAMATESRLQQQQMMAAVSSVNGGRKTGVTQAMSKTVTSAKPNQGENPPDPSKLPRPEATWTMEINADMYIHSNMMTPIKAPGASEDPIIITPPWSGGGDIVPPSGTRPEPGPRDIVTTTLLCSSFVDWRQFDIMANVHIPDDVVWFDPVEVAREEYERTHATGEGISMPNEDGNEMSEETPMGKIRIYPKDYLGLAQCARDFWLHGQNKTSDKKEIERRNALWNKLSTDEKSWIEKGLALFIGLLMQLGVCGLDALIEASNLVEGMIDALNNNGVWTSPIIDAGGNNKYIIEIDFSKHPPQQRIIRLTGPSTSSSGGLGFVTDKYVNFGDNTLPRPNPGGGGERILPWPPGWTPPVEF